MIFSKLKKETLPVTLEYGKSDPNMFSQMLVKNGDLQW